MMILIAYRRSKRNGQTLWYTRKAKILRSFHNWWKLQSWRWHNRSIVANQDLLIQEDEKALQFYNQNYIKQSWDMNCFSGLIYFHILPPTFLWRRWNRVTRDKAAVSDVASAFIFINTISNENLLKHEYYPTSYCKKIGKIILTNPCTPLFNL